MYSLSTRLSQISFFYYTCLACLGIFNVLTTIFGDYKPKVNSFQYKTMYTYFNDYAATQHSTGRLTFDIDFTGCINWNSNLVFSWISATYETQAGNASVTIWDRIMLRDDVASQKVQELDLMTFYPLVDMNDELRGKKITLELHWEHMPVFGPILKKKMPLGVYQVPIEELEDPPMNVVAREYDYADYSDRKYYE